MKEIFLILPVALVLCLPSTSSATGGRVISPRPPAQDTLTLPAGRLEGQIQIDGRLDEAGWGRAPAARRFVQGEPNEGAVPAMPTQVRVLQDESAIYVGARMEETGSGRVADQLVRRDETGQYDYFEIAVDPNLDGQTGYLFRVGASGVEYDAFLSEQTALPTTDVSWNAVWDSEIRIDSTGWTVEMRIPLSQIRYETRTEAQAWGVNFVRRRLASNSVSYFSLESRTESGRISQWGRLTGLELPASGTRLELRPYVVSNFTGRPTAPGDPLTESDDVTARAGLDLSYGLGSNFTLDATINPDFGQVEVDPAVVNLTVFETFFPEKRPFFAQDKQLFNFQLATGQGTLFFSRRIGGRPTGRPPAEARFSEAPDRTTILGAGKLTGRTPDGWTVGAIAAVTDQETGRAARADGSELDEFVVEPTTEYGVGRVRKDFRGGATSVGAVLTGVNRHLPNSGRLDHLPSRAVSGGVDFDHQWGGPNQRRWSLNGFFAATHVTGSSEAMLALQTNPQHYFQRPDARALAPDSAATSMTGHSWRLEFGRQSGEHWTWAASLSEISPGFAPNDMGFNFTNEDVTASARAAYRDITPGPLFRSWSFSGFWSHSWRHAVFETGDWGRSSAEGLLFLTGSFELLNNWQLSLTGGFQPEVQSDTGTRGGPLMTNPSDRSLAVGLTTDPRRAVSFRPSVSYATQGRDAGHRVQVGLDVTWRPSPSWEVNLRPQVTRLEDAAQYVATAPDLDFGPTFGRRYLFSDIERTQASMVTRLDVTFSPHLSLQLFAQPLLSAGEFLTTKELSRPESFDFRTFAEGELDGTADGVARCAGGSTCVGDGLRHVDFDGDGTLDFRFPDPDFNLRSLRANAVLRWEFRPGSTLFLVWQHDARDRAPLGDFELGRDLDALFDAEPTNTLSVKASYFLDL